MNVGIVGRCGKICKGTAKIQESWYGCHPSPTRFLLMVKVQKSSLFLPGLIGNEMIMANQGEG